MTSSQLDDAMLVADDLADFWNCSVCSSGEHEDQILLCDGCDLGSDFGSLKCLHLTWRPIVDRESNLVQVDSKHLLSPQNFLFPGISQLLVGVSETKMTNSHDAY